MLWTLVEVEMEPWVQTYTPIAGSLSMSALVAAIPIVVLLVRQERTLDLGAYGELKG